jgi:hypothetical protein
MTAGTAARQILKPSIKPCRKRRRYLSAGHTRQRLTFSHATFISPEMYSSVRFISCLLTRNYSAYNLAVLCCLAPTHRVHFTACPPCLPVLPVPDTARINTESCVL